jgi:hypothetical protein
MELIKDLCRVDHSCSVILEEILTSPSKQSPVVGLLGLKETILVAGWYIWWQRREAVKGESVANVKKISVLDTCDHSKLWCSDKGYSS